MECANVVFFKISLSKLFCHNIDIKFVENADKWIRINTILPILYYIIIYVV